MIRLPFFRPISLRFCPSSPVRLRLSSQSRPASRPLAASRLPGFTAVVPDGALGGGGIGLTGSVSAGWSDAAWPDDDGPTPGCRFQAPPVASGRVLSPVAQVTY